RTRTFDKRQRRAPYRAIIAVRMSENDPPSVPVPDYRPVERFWPYVDLPEQPTDEELARLNPELAEALFGRPRRPFSGSVEFAPLEGPDAARALELARASAEYVEIRSGSSLRYRARFYPQDAIQLRHLFDLVGALDSTYSLVDD